LSCLLSETGRRKLEPFPVQNLRHAKWLIIRLVEHAQPPAARKLRPTWISFFQLPRLPFHETMPAAMATILVVDDDPGMRKPLARLLKMEGYDVVCAENAIMAMASALGNKPDLILLDVAIPPMDGLTFLFLLREKPNGKDIPVIVISGHQDEGTMRRAKALGVMEYLVKSQYKTADLLDLVRKYCPTCPESVPETLPQET
jgi:CheY-like chemotaxis protein